MRGAFKGVIGIIASILCVFAYYAYKESAQEKKVDFVIFSFNRPLQLYALLESSEQHLKNCGSINVIYRASTPEFSAGFDIVKDRFPSVTYYAQSSDPAKDFKPLVLKAVCGSNSPSEYVMFGVDDMIVTDDVDLAYCVDAIEKYQAWGFYLRLGQNISYCHTMDIQTPFPQGTWLNQNLFQWNFKTATGGDWSYPNTTDMTVLRKKDITTFLYTGNYTNPNTFEYDWQRFINPDATGLCFAYSKNINIPLNLVNTSWANRAMHLYTPEELLVKLNEGLKIDTRKFYQVRNNAPHVEYEPTFIKR